MERTYVTTTWQFFFEDETEIVATIGHATPTNTGDGLHIELEWQTETPTWAKNMSDEDLINSLGLRDLEITRLIHRHEDAHAFIRDLDNLTKAHNG